MVNPQVSLLDLTVEDGILGDVMQALIGDKNIMPVHRHDGLHVDMVNENIEEDLNTTGNKDSSATYHKVLNTTCDEDSNTTCDEDSNTTCDEDSNTTYVTRHRI